MIFGRKNRADSSDEAADAADLDATDLDATDLDADLEASVASSDGDADDEADPAGEDAEPVDYREIGRAHV